MTLLVPALVVWPEQHIPIPIPQLQDVQFRMRRSIFFSFACIDLKFCIQPPDHCRIISHGLDLNYKVRNCACAHLSFLALHIST